MASSKQQKRQARQAQRQAQERNRRIVNWTIFVLIVAASAYFVWAQGRPAESLAPAETIALGAQVYETNCASCHGDEGQGHVLAEAPALDESEHVWHHADGQLQILIENGGTLMPAFGEQFSDEEVVAVIRYVQTWWTAEQLAAQQENSRVDPLQ
jgi:mono/diheme cytochrome c family protein